MRSRVKLPTPTALDRLIGAFSPKWMNARMNHRLAMARYQAMASAGRGGYNAADRRRGVFVNGRRLAGDGDAAFLPDAEDLRALSSELVRNNPLAAGALDTIATKVVGGGLQLQARPDRKFLGLTDADATRIEVEIERLWDHLMGRIDFDRRFHFSQLEYTLYHLMLEHGDVFVIKTGERNPGDLFDLKIQIVEGPRVCNRDFAADSDTQAGGIEFDDKGRPIAIHVANRHPHDYSKATAKTIEWTRVPIWGEKTGRRNVLQLMAPTRARQTRGVPVLASTLELFKQLGTWTDSEVAAAVTTSAYALINTTEGGSEFPETNEDSTSDATSSGGLGRVDLTIEPGMVIDGLGPNEKVEGFSPNRPNPDFEPFFNAIVGMAAVALGLSGSVALRKFTASYSASKGELMQVWEVMMRRRRNYSRALHQDLYEEMQAEAWGRGLLTLRGFMNPLMRSAWSKARWIGPSQGQLNPVQEVTAAKLKVEAGFSTVEEQTAEICGGDFDANMEQRTREITLMRAIGADTELTAGGAAPPPPPPPDDPAANDDDTEDETREPS